MNQPTLVFIILGLTLASRNLALGKPRRLVTSVALLAAAVAAILAGWLLASVALSMAAASVLTGVLPLREAYKGIDWPIIGLLAAMIPVGQALETSGGAQLVADGLPLTVVVMLIAMSLILLVWPL